MNDCYWGGEVDQFYYECDTGRIIGEIKRHGLGGTYEALYFDSWNNPNMGRYIDEDRARKAVERCRKQDVEVWERRREAWKNHPEVEETPIETPRKTWWKIWE